MPVGPEVGETLGLAEGFSLGVADGSAVGDWLGVALGFLEGELDGFPVGVTLGVGEGMALGETEGTLLGKSVFLLGGITGFSTHLSEVGAGAGMGTVKGIKKGHEDGRIA